MTEEQAKKQDAKQEPVNEELTGDQTSGLSGGDNGPILPTAGGIQRLTNKTLTD